MKLTSLGSAASTLILASFLVGPTLLVGCGSDAVGNDLAEAKDFRSNASAAQVQQQSTQLGTVLDEVKESFSGKGAALGAETRRGVSPLATARAFLGEKGGDDVSGGTGANVSLLPSFDADRIVEGGSCEAALESVTSSFDETAKVLTRIVEVLRQAPADGAEVGGVKMTRTSDKDFPLGFSFSANGKGSSDGGMSVEGFARAAGDTRGLLKIELEEKTSASFEFPSAPDLKKGLGGLGPSGVGLRPVARSVAEGGKMVTKSSASLKALADLEAKLIDLEQDVDVESSFGSKATRTTATVKAGIKGGEKPSVSSSSEFSVRVSFDGKSEETKGSVALTTELTESDVLTMKGDARINGQGGSVELVLSGRGDACKVKSFKSSLPTSIKR